MTNEEKKKLYAALSAPFPESAIQRTDGRVTGKGYDTSGIGYQFVVNRLNEVVGLGSWRTHREITIKTMTTAKGRAAYEAACDMALELGQWDAEGTFIPFAEALADGGHTSFNEADARKGAFTNALKKAAAMFGCGRQAYEGTLDDDNTPAEEPKEENPRFNATQVTHATQPQANQPQTASGAPDASRSGPPSLPAPAPQYQAPPSPGPTRTRLTAKQLGALWAIARKLGHDQSQFRQAIKTREGVQPEFLSREAASRLIGEMSAQLGNGHAGTMDERQPGQDG